MARKRRRKFGNQPNRKEGVRGASGRLVRAYRGSGEGDTIPPEVLDRRAEEMGLPRDSERLSKADGSNLGILVERGIIGVHHKDAALKLWDVYRLWKKATGAKPRHPKVMTIGGISHSGGHDEREIDMTRARLAFAKAIASGGSDAGRRLLDAVAIDPKSIFESEPLLFVDGPIGDSRRKQLQRAMDGLCNHFGIRAQDAA